MSLLPPPVSGNNRRQGAPCTDYCCCSRTSLLLLTHLLPARHRPHRTGASGWQLRPRSRPRHTCIRPLIAVLWNTRMSVDHQGLAPQSHTSAAALRPAGGSLLARRQLKEELLARPTAVEPRRHRGTLSTHVCCTRNTGVCRTAPGSAVLPDQLEIAGSAARRAGDSALDGCPPLPTGGLQARPAGVMVARHIFWSLSCP